MAGWTDQRTFGEGFYLKQFSVVWVQTSAFCIPQGGYNPDAGHSLLISLYKSLHTELQKNTTHTETQKQRSPKKWKS